MTVFEMEGFLRGKCFPGDMKVNETNAEYLVRKLTRVDRQLESLDKLADLLDKTVRGIRNETDK